MSYVKSLENQGPSHIKNFKIKFENIPMMTVIAGINGIGKTMLLQAIRSQCQNEKILCLFIGTNNTYVRLDQIEMKHEQMVVEKLLKLKDYALKRHTKGFVEEEEFENYLKFANEKELKSNHIDNLYKKIIIHFNPPNRILKLHYGNYVEQLEQKCQNEEFGSCLEKLNDFLEIEKFKFKIQVDNYQKIKLTNNYVDNLDFDGLSDGEKILITQLFWKFEGYPKLNEEIVYLLDEPDRHLHPSAVKQLIESIQNLATKMKIQIIMTTQNPITLNFVYEDFLYVMDYVDENKNEISILKASESKIHPSTLLTNDLISIHKKFYQIYVQSESDKDFLEILNEQQNLSKHIPIMFKAVSQKKTQPTLSSKISEDSRYQILKIFDSIRLDSCLRKETDYIREILTNRLEIFKDSPESKIIDMMEIVKDNNHLDFMFGLLDRRTSIIKNGRKKRIIYPDRYDLGNYVFDPFHVFLFLKKKRPESDLVKSIQSLNENSHSQNWHQEILNYITSAIKQEIDAQRRSKEFDFQTKIVSFSKPKMDLEYEKFLLDTDSTILLEFIEKAFLNSELGPKRKKITNQGKLFDSK
jgi:predicted ATPase